jgi:hypothetical protein
MERAVTDSGDIWPSFPRSAWERTSGTLCVPSREGQGATQSVAHWRSHAERGNETTRVRRENPRKNYCTRNGSCLLSSPAPGFYTDEQRLPRLTGAAGDSAS